LTITDLAPENIPAARDLILAGLAEHWGTLDLSMNPDLSDLSSSYGEAVFLVAWLDGQLVGTGALIEEAPGVGRIVRMSVDKDHRRRGIARSILAELIRRGRGMGYRHIVLETTETWQDAIQFYRNAGFRYTHSAEGDVHFVMDLANGTPPVIAESSG
jgi:GNAT superfamily N-acetyltransferase